MSLLTDKRRLVLEHAAMRERWGDAPRFRYNNSPNHFWWEHVVRIEGNEFPIRIDYPDDYPATPPEIVIGTGMPSGTPHLLGGNRICWFYPGETKRNRNIWDPSRDTAAMCVGVAQRWFLAFLVWQVTGEWPVPDAYGDN